MDIALVAQQSTRVQHGRERRATETQVKTPSIVAWMIAAMAIVTALAYWDEQRESKAALDDFTEEQVTLAAALASSLGERIKAVVANDASQEPPASWLAAVGAIEHPGVVRVLLARPGDSVFVSGDGTPVAASSVARALESGERSLRLSRAEAAALGLPARTAVAGLHRIDLAGMGRWGVAVVATARAERDRELRAQWRLVLGVTVASGLVVAFGGYALRKQRRELELGHKLALAQIRNERDERLVRADKLATMGALATGIAHEVSTPLGVILGRAEQLLPKQSDDRARRAVEAITQQTERIFAVIRGFLSLARSGQPALEHADSTVLARAAVALVEHRFEKAGVRLHSELGADLPKVACDPRLFEQVLVNVLLNACDASSEGTTVMISVHGNRDRVVFAVTDTGAGISPEVAERAIEPFFTTKPEGVGTGLGLAIANEIVKHHCGTLQLSQVAGGRGTRVSVELPAVRETDHG
jgi:two-component system NtrC family sensor kinase